MMLSTPPLTLYIHFPWCIRKCPYCDFNSHVKPDALPEADYVDALLADFIDDVPRIAGREIEAIFLGGGTPSLFSATAIGRLLNAIAERVSFSPDVEITLEANPGTVEYERFAGYRDAGVNRLSIGVQSFDPQQLKILGRIHGPDEARRAIEAAHAAGFEQINIDLMHGLPDQSRAAALRDIETALSLKPSHLSWYQLTIEPNTLFHHKPPDLPSEEIIDTMQKTIRQRLTAAGFLHYEVSAYCLPDSACRHNVNYWRFGDYLGIGAGAHSKLTDQENARIYRLVKHKNPRDFLNVEKLFLQNESIILAENLPFEFMLNALRIYEPIAFDLYTQRTGLERDTILPILQGAENSGLVRLSDDEFCLTDLGKRFTNDVISYFLQSC